MYLRGKQGQSKYSLMAAPISNSTDQPTPLSQNTGGRNRGIGWLDVCFIRPPLRPVANSTAAAWRHNACVPFSAVGRWRNAGAKVSLRLEGKKYSMFATAMCVYHVAA